MKCRRSFVVTSHVAAEGRMLLVKVGGDQTEKWHNARSAVHHVSLFESCHGVGGSIHTNLQCKHDKVVT